MFECKKKKKEGLIYHTWLDLLQISHESAYLMYVLLSITCTEQPSCGKAGNRWPLP
jgi:hypothetical protein